MYFYIVFLHITMYSYSLQYLHQLDKSTRRRQNNISCTRFRKYLDLWFCYDVPLYSLYGLDTCRNMLLLVKLLILILQLPLSHTCLASFDKGYEKIKHVSFNLLWNTNTVIPIGTNFYKHNQEHFLFLFQLSDLSAMNGVALVSQRLVLLEASSPCLPLRRRAEWCFLLNLTSLSRQALFVKREYQCPV